MAGINGVGTVTYGVENVALGVRHFVDFGLPLIEHRDGSVLFQLEEGSKVIIRPLAKAVVEGQKLVGSGVQQGRGIFARAPHTNDHHNMYWLKADLPFPGLDGKTRFHHVNHGVEGLDEAMVGANYMERRGWQKSAWGLGRHRIANSVFRYLPCPAGGDAEYGTDSDILDDSSLDDSWVPRVWNANFGMMSFMHNLQPWLPDEAPWEIGYADGATPLKTVKPHPSQPEAIAPAKMTKVPQ